MNTINNLPIKASQLFKNAINFYKKRFLPIFIISLIPALVAYILSLTTNAPNAYISTWFSGLTEEEFGMKINLLSLLGSFLFVIFMFIISSVVYLWGNLALLCTIKDQKLKIIEVYKLSWKKLLSFWLLSLFYSLICFSGTILLVVPGIIFSIWFSLGSWIFIDQNIKGLDALVLSRQYIKGQIYYIFKKWFFLFFIYVLAMILVSVLSKNISLSEPFNSLINTVISALIVPVHAIYGYLIYQNIKSMKGDIVLPANNRFKILLKFLTWFSPVILILGAIIGIYFGFKYLKSEKINSVSPKETATYSELINQTKDASNINYVAEISSAFLRYETGNEYPTWCDVQNPSICDSLNSKNSVSLSPYVMSNLSSQQELSNSMKSKIQSENNIYFYVLNNKSTSDLFSKYFVCFQPQSDKYLKDKNTKYHLNNNSIDSACDNTKEKCWYCVEQTD